MKLKDPTWGDVECNRLVIENHLLGEQAWKVGSALSVPLNIAEASGRTGSRDNAKHFASASGSALECGAIIDACQILQLVDQETYTDAKHLIVAEVAMLLHES